MEKTLTIEYWMSKNAAVIDKEETVFGAVKEMVERKIGSVIAVDKDHKPIGILTERDILKKIVALGFDAQAIKVKDAMAKNVITINISDTYTTANKLIRDRNIRHLPVVNVDGKLVGVVSVRDLRKPIE